MFTEKERASNTASFKVISDSSFSAAGTTRFCERYRSARTDAVLWLNGRHQRGCQSQPQRICHTSNPKCALHRLGSRVKFSLCKRSNRPSLPSSCKFRRLRSLSGLLSAYSFTKLRDRAASRWPDQSLREGHSTPARCKRCPRPGLPGRHRSGRRERRWCP